MIPVDVQQISHQVEPKDHEKVLIKELAPIFARSPREAKRFINLYRFIKAMGRHGETGEKDDQSYKYIGLALAIVVGKPAAAMLLSKSDRPLIGENLSQYLRQITQHIQYRPEQAMAYEELKDITEWLDLNSSLNLTDAWLLDEWLGVAARHTFSKEINEVLAARN